jgi:ABC-type phosphate transport system substrate-binding protein
MTYRSRIVAITTAFVAGTAIVMSAHAMPSRGSYVVVCNPNSSVTAVNRTFLQDAFLKRVTVWPTGEATRPVDLPPGSPTRRRFTEDVLKRKVDAVRNFWQQRIFTGRDLPPPELGDDDQVIKFVLRVPGAVGYVSAGAALNGAKVLTVK